MITDNKEVIIMSEVTAPIMTDATGQSIDSKLNSLLGKMDNLAEAFQPNASGIVYSNTTSGLTGDDVQEAIDEVAGDITEINTNLSHKTPYINPTQTVIDDTFTSGTSKEITIPQDGYYYMLAINESAGNISVTIYNNSDLAVSHIISSSPQVNADWIRVTSNLLPLKAGSKIWCRPFFTKYCYLIKLG